MIAWLATSTIFAASFQFEVYRSNKKNVYSMGYRLANRIFYKEKKQTERECATKLSEYALTSLTLDKNYKFHMELKDHGIRVGQGKRSSVEFACNLKVSGDFSQTIIEKEEFDSRNKAVEHCSTKLEALQSESEDLIIAEVIKNECLLYSL